MIDFEFHIPTKVIFGKNAEQYAGRETKAFGGTRALLHYGSDRVRNSGLMSTVRKSLDEQGISYVELGGVVPNPRLSAVYKGIEFGMKEKIDFVLAVGGGSVIDSSKAIAIGIAHDGVDIWDINDKKIRPTKTLPVGCIVTIAAAGSETSDSMVLTKEEGWIKKGIHEPICRPAFAIMNPELTYTCPPYQTASGCVDIMMHSLERYFSQDKNCDLTDRFAEAVLRTIIKYAPQALADPHDYNARAEIMWASSMSHNDVTGAGKIHDYASHQLEQELSGMFDVAHGAGLAAVWSSWARYVCKNDVDRFIRYAINVWDCEYDMVNPENTVLEGISRSENFFQSLEMPIRISGLGIGELTDAQIDELSLKCTFFETRKIGNFVRLDREDIKAIYRMAR
ncbi:MAG: iron-containing alcohol dehydrogenase [Synergistaceae bacterium]|jgi:alcohol dehydrogenase YqhD (iron-dependent ADH family)|nr:iron-containing alcohol dehydrogenase [Synergistaceae bacterium]